MIRNLSLLVALGALTLGATARADKPAPPLKGAAPPAEAAPSRAKTVDAGKPFDASGLGKRDAASDKAVAAVEAQCLSDPMSREGPTPAESARCQVAVARLLARGKHAAPSIFARLNRGADADAGYYATSRLLFALSKIEHDDVRLATVRGYESIAKEELEDHEGLLWQMDDTLRGMYGAGPAIALPWAPSVVRDEWEAMRAAAADWVVFAGEHAGKARKRTAADALARARRERADDDPAKAYRGISFLLDKSPGEALKAAQAYLKRSDLEPAVASAFEGLESDAEWRVEEQRERAKARAKK